MYLSPTPTDQRSPIALAKSDLYVFTEGDKKIGDGVWVPSSCWKIVIQLKTGKILHVLLFENDSDAKVEEITLEKLESILKWKPNLTY